MRGRRSSRGARLTLALVLLGLAAANVVPIWACTWLPLGDFGGHLELMDVVARYNDATAYREVYYVASGAQANVFDLWFAGLLGGAVSTLTLGKVLLTAYVVGLPCSAALLCVAFDRSPWLALATVPWTYNAMLALGSIGFIVGLPVLFATIALCRLWLRTRRPRFMWLTAIGAASLFTFHALHFLIGLTMCFALIVSASATRRELRRLLVLAPALVPFGLWFYRKFVVLERTEAGQALGTGTLFHFEAVRLPFAELLAQIYAWGPQFFRDDTDEITARLVVTAWLCALVAGWFSRRPPGRFLERYALEGLVVGCVVAYFVLPSHIRDVQLIVERFVAIAMLLCLLTPRIDLRGRARTAFVVFVGLTSLSYSARIMSRFRSFERDVLRGMPSAVAELPQRSRLAYVMWDPTNPTTMLGATWHIPKAVHAISNGGVTNDSFAKHAHCPIQYRAGQTPRRLGHDFWNDGALGGYDAVLLWSSEEPRGALSSRGLRLRYHAGGWWLFDIERARQ